MNPFSASPGPDRRTVLTIAGHDPCSGAGITADLQTFAAHRLFGTSAITALTAQSTLGVAEVRPVEPDLLRRILQLLTADLPPSGIKIGMLGSAEIAIAIADFLVSFHRKTTSPKKGTGPSLTAVPVPAVLSPVVLSPVVLDPVVLDPVLRSSSGADLLPPDALEVLHDRLIPHVSWITPNWSELAALTGQPVQTLAQAEAATHDLGRRHPHLHIVATAGDHAQPTDILRLPSGETRTFLGEHIDSTSTHGTGCAFSSALLALLVLRDTPTEAVRSAKHFVTEAIRHAPDLGQGNGPLNLAWHLL